MAMQAAGRDHDIRLIARRTALLNVFAGLFLSFFCLLLNGSVFSYESGRVFLSTLSAMAVFTAAYCAFAASVLGFCGRFETPECVFLGYIFGFIVKFTVLAVLLIAVFKFIPVIPGLFFVAFGMHVFLQHAAAPAVSVRTEQDRGQEQ